MRCNFILIKNRDSSIGSRKRSRSRHKESQNKKEFKEVHKIRHASNEKLSYPKEEKIPLPEKKTNSGNYFLIFKEPVESEEPIKISQEQPQRYEYQPHLLKYYEEFLKLKQAEIKKEIKLALPKLIDNDTIREHEKSKKNFPERSLISKNEILEETDIHNNSKLENSRTSQLPRIYPRFSSNS
jgi:hypothetical protein